MSLLAFIQPVAYVLLQLWMHFDWLALKKGTESLTTNPNPQVQLSVVIPFRNERSNLEPLLKSLHLASSKVSFELEFIFVDDESDDDGAELLSNSKLQVRLLNNKGQGKKAALATGILAAKHPWILSLDADIIVPEAYFEQLSSLPELTETTSDLIILPVKPIGQRNFLSAFQQLEFLSLMGTTAAFASAQNPILCNGANLLFQKDLWLKQRKELHPDLASGDDVFLLQAIKKDGGKISIAQNIQLAVATPVSASWGDFLQQRIRWGSKAKYYSDPSLKAVSWLVFLSQLNFVALLIALPFSDFYFKINVLWIWSLYLAMSMLFLGDVSKWYQLKLRPYLLASAIFYPFYLIFTAFAALFRKAEWKGRVSK